MSARLIALASAPLGFSVGAFRVAEVTPRRARRVERANALSPADSLQARRLAGDVVQRFLQAWRKTWLASERQRLKIEVANADRRAHAHCHSPYVYDVVQSANRGFAKCPNASASSSLPAASIAAGSIILDVSSLSRGTYLIDVTAAMQGRADARAGRVLTIR